MSSLREEHRLWTVFDAAEFLGFHPDQIRRMVRDGRFPLGVVSLLPQSRVYRFDPQKLKAWAFHELESPSLTGVTP